MRVALLRAVEHAAAPESVEKPGLWALARQSVAAWNDDYASSMGAALAYYTLFSLSPLLLLVITIAGLAFGAEAARGAIVSQLGGLIGEEGARAIQGLLKSADRPAQSVLASIVSIATLAIGATSMFAELQSDFDRIWRAPATSAPSGIRSLVHARILSLGVIVSIGFLLLVSLVVSAALSYLSGLLGGAAAVLHAVELALSIAVMSGLFAVIFKVLPSVHVRWGDVWLGALVTAVLFSIGKYAIGLYIGKTALASSYGAAGTLVVAIAWVYYSAQIFFFGAEFTREFAAAGSAGQRGAEAANSDFAREDDAMLERARGIVKGKDPVLMPQPRAR
jgi:membrane protein